jgi:hypothetical protein
MKPSDLKANEKLPRGTYFYIQVGHRFYAGQEIEQREVESDPTEHRALTQFTKDGRQTSSFRRQLSLTYWWSSRSKGPRGKRRERDIAKDSLPKYAKPRERPKKVIRKEFTGRSVPRLTDDFSQAKQFRRKDSVLNACETLQTLYGETGATVSVHYKGETE